jgi:23S rRNA (uridine2552-2'-O)-methyltransferase
MSSHQWKLRQRNDPWVKKAQAEGWRARAAFKLLELDRQASLFAGAKVVVDLGAAPGSWSQVARHCLPADAWVIALDILPMAPIEGVEVIEGDFREDEALAELERLLAGARVDLVMSDMAPNISGIAASDQARSMHLAELALTFSQDWLDQNGRFVVKVFQGEGFDGFLAELRRCFRTVKVRKPEASRPDSREVYLVARGLRPR